MKQKKDWIRLQLHLLRLRLFFLPFLSSYQRFPACITASLHGMASARTGNPVRAGDGICGNQHREHAGVL